MPGGMNLETEGSVTRDCRQDFADAGGIGLIASEMRDGSDFGLKSLVSCLRSAV